MYNTFMLYDMDDFQFELYDDGTAALIKYKGGEAIPCIPGEADGHTVTAIGGWAFGRFIVKTPLLGVKLPDSLISIGDYAFSNCKKLSDIVIPSCVRSVGAAAFSGCVSLLRAVLPQLTEINDWLFKDCRSLREIKIPSSVKYIGKGAFSGCRTLVEIFLPDGVSSVEFETFRDCRSLAVFDLPPAVTRIKDGAFKDCNSLSHLTVHERVTFIGWQDVFPKGMIIHAAPGSYAEAYAKTKRLPFIPLEIPAENKDFADDNTMGNIPERAFADDLEITEAIIPEGTGSVGNGAYSGCASLSYVALPESVLTIGIDAFAGTSVKDITVPSGVVKIGWNAFPHDALLRGEKGGAAEAYAKKNNLRFEPLLTGNIPVNKSMREVLLAVWNFGGREIFANAGMFKNLICDLLPGEGKNAGIRNVLYAAVSQLKVLSASEQDDAAAVNRFATALMDLGYQPRLAREAAVSFWAVLCYPHQSEQKGEN